ncbi:MAG: hypothetical protein P4L10_11400 [Acidobacteriaceae bacterium]|nr:hypothetical protein [Acidobacteriaceae bacterium]
MHSNTARIAEQGEVISAGHAITRAQQIAKGLILLAGKDVDLVIWRGMLNALSMA